MKTINGDLLELADAGEFNVIVQGCNCYNTMGGGIANAIKDKWPQAYAVDCTTIAGDRNKLGTYTFAAAKHCLIINAYTQFGFNRNGTTDDLFEYTAFKLILEKLSHFPDGTTFGFPLIGCGLAGGNKTRIVAMLEQFALIVESNGGSVTIVEFAQ